MSFGLIQFTNRGRALQAKAQTGVRLVFTRIAVGDGQLSGQDISDLTALIHEIKSVTLNKYKTLPGGKAVVGGVLSNQDIVNGFWWRELGLFAMDPDIGEILYCYGNAGELAEYIPSPGGAQILEKQVDIISIIGNAQNVSAEIDQSLIYATIQDVNNLRDELNEHKANTNNPHGVTAEQIGAETPAGAQQKANQAEANAKAYADTVANSALALGKSYTDQNLATHEGKTASTSQKGHVQLSSSLTSTSETTAATSNAVKQLNDKITTLNNTVAALYVTNEATGKKYTLHFDDIGLYLKEV